MHSFEILHALRDGNLIEDVDHAAEDRDQDDQCERERFLQMWLRKRCTQQCISRYLVLDMPNLSELR